MTRRWHHNATGAALLTPDAPPHQPHGSRAAIEAAIWREYSLALIFPRLVPDWIDDETIGEKLRECAANNRLPWQLDIPESFGCYRWS